MKIICIGRNYRDHIRELSTMGHAEGDPAEPVFFLKPDTALLRNNRPFYVPSFSNEVHYETELVFRINKVGKCVSRKFACKYYSEVGLGIDFTARDLQRTLTAAGLPWEKAKGFDHSAAISPEFIPLEELGGDTCALKFDMWLNGEPRQHGDSSQMIFSIDEIISHVSEYMSLRVGDLIFTGTPAGVGAVAQGDHIRAELGGRTLLDFDIK